jgi:hypothetical protein
VVLEFLPEQSVCETEKVELTYSGDQIISILWEGVLEQRIVDLIIAEPRGPRLRHRAAIVLVVQGSLREDSCLTSPSPIPVWKTKRLSCLGVLLLLWMCIVNAADEIDHVSVKDGLNRFSKSTISHGGILPRTSNNER